MNKRKTIFISKNLSVLSILIQWKTLFFLKLEIKTIRAKITKIENL